MSMFVQHLQTAETIKHQRKLAHSAMLLSLLLGALTLSACQTAPMTTTTNNRTSTVTIPSTVLNDDVISDNVLNDDVLSDNVLNDNVLNDDGFDDSELYEASDATDYPVEPYNSPIPAPNTYPTQSAPATPEPVTPSSNDRYTIPPFQGNSEPFFEPIIVPRVQEEVIPAPPIVPSHSELLQRARQNSQQQSRALSSGNSDLPAFRNLMQTGTNQLRANDLTAAENSFTRAQRLAPRSSAVYFYLSQVALKKNQPRKAEAMARRGLSVSQDSSRRRALWQIILRSGQMQNNTRVINEAQRALR